MENSKIEWTDHTFNPWIGCSKVHAGCAHCYAEYAMDRRYGKAKWGPGGTRVVTSPANWANPRRWHREAMAWFLHVAICERHGIDDPLAEWRRRDGGNDPPTTRRPRVFCASLADVFEGPESMPKSEWPKVEAARNRLFALIDSTPYLDWLLLTKRPENIARLMPLYLDGISICRRNVWLGTSISDQASADKMIPELLQCRDLCAGLFVSAEPLLGPVTLDRRHAHCPVHDFESGFCTGRCSSLRTIDWLIVGGESGINARPMHANWARSLRDQCQAAGVPFFFKQWGAFVPANQITNKGYLGQSARRTDDHPVRLAKQFADATLDGREWREFYAPPKHQAGCYATDV